MRECPNCNYRNNPEHATTCVACRLELPRSNPYTPLPTPNQKMVVFDLDKTLYDLTRRERIAKREGHKPGSDAWYNSMNKPQHIPKDTVIPGTLEFARKLEQDGYAIAYLTGRPDTIKAATRQKLKEDGFPIHRFKEDLLFLSPTVNSTINSLANYKKGILTRLSNEFDVAFFFDDSPEFREAAKTVKPRIPGIYPSIADYTGEETPKRTRSNPSHPADDILPIYAGTPTSKYTNKGMITAEIQIGRNLIKDVGEVVQSIYRGLVGGRTAMAEKRMAMALASMQKELSDRATAKGGNAVANLKVDYEMIPESATLTLIATADAIKMASPKKAKSNPLRLPKKKPKAIKPSPTIEKRIVAYFEAFKKSAKSRAREEAEEWVQQEDGKWVTVYNEEEYQRLIKEEYDEFFTYNIEPSLDFGKHYMSMGMTFNQPSWGTPNVVEDMFKVLKHVGYKPTSKINGKTITWSRFMEDARRGFTDAYLAYDERYDPVIEVDKKGYAKLQGYLRYLQEAGKIDGAFKTGYADGRRPRRALFYFHFEPRSNPTSELVMVNPLKEDGTYIHWENAPIGPDELRDYDGEMLEEAYEHHQEELKEDEEFYEETGADYFQEQIVRHRESIKSIEGEFERRESEYEGLRATLPDPQEEFMGPVAVNPPKPRKKRNKAGNMIKEPVKKYLQRFMGNPQMVKEFPDNAQRFAVGLSYAKKFYGEKTVNKHYPAVRTNPGVSVADAKKMYKQFHQKNPSKVEKKTMNIGETWIGLGKAWSIGYRSGKETGDENQKYIHNFGVDEETGKKFKEPDLFYVPGEGGSDDLLIVTGGDWYIDVDADGKVSWIYI